MDCGLPEWQASCADIALDGQGALATGVPLGVKERPTQEIGARVGSVQGGGGGTRATFALQLSQFSLRNPHVVGSGRPQFTEIITDETWRGPC